MNSLRALCCFLLLVLVSCGGDSGTGIDGSGNVSRLEIVFGESTVPFGESTALSAIVRDRRGQEVTNVKVAWTSESPAIAIVVENKVIGVSPGSTRITAAADGMVASREFVVSSVNDVAILDAQMTQGVQEPDHSVPIILDGLPAVVNVLLRPRARAVKPTEIVLRVLSNSGAIEHADTVKVAGSVADNGYLQPTAQFLIPAQKLRMGLRWQVVRDPRGVEPDDSTANDKFPRIGTQPLPTVEVPPLQVHLVPVSLAAEGGATGVVSTALIESYMRDFRRMMPIGRMDVTIGETLVSNQTFGIKPKGGDNIFWSRILSQLDVARMASGTHRSKYWVGIIQRPTGYTAIDFAGYAYRPKASQGDGAGSRTAVVLSLGASSPWYARTIIVHELGHTFGRSHTPCGDPAQIDFGFPTADGLIEQIGHDVYNWSAGFTTRAVGIPTTTGDLMGYCPERWSSVYTYRGVMDFRRTSNFAVSAANTASTRESSDESMAPSLVLSGMTDGAKLTLFPPDRREMPQQPSTSGSNNYELIDAAGRVLHAGRFDLNATGTDIVRTFLVWVPLAQLSGDVAALRVTTGGQSRLMLIPRSN